MRIPFSGKLVLLLVIITVMVMAAFMLTRVYFANEQMHAELEDKSLLVAHRISNSVNPSIWNIYSKSMDRSYSEEFASTVVDSELLDPYLIGVRVFGNFGHLYMGRVRLEDDSIVQYVKSDHEEYLNNADHSQTYPIKNGSMTIGKVEVFLTHEPYDERFGEFLLIELIQAVAVSVLFITFLYFAIRHALLIPMKSMEISRRTLESMDEAVVITDADNKIIDVNPAYTEITGYSLEEVVGKNPSIASSGNHSEEFYEAMWRTIRDEGFWMGELLDRRKDGADIPLWTTINTVLDDSGAPLYYIAVFRDISERKEAEKQLQKLAYYDSLTDLPNRMLFLDRLGNEISLAKRKDELVGLFFIDLDKFKHVNDTLGHHIGDKLLNVIAGRLRQRLRDSDTLSRLGGDEFTVIIPGLKEFENLAELATQLINITREPVNLEGTEVFVSASIGIAVYPKDGEDANQLIKHADMAMYEAKELGRNRYHYFSEEINDYVTRRVELRLALNQALKNNEFILYYQPKVDLFKHRIIGAEGLIRWQRKGVGLVFPDSFIPVAEESEIILSIGNWVIEQACIQLDKWKKQGREDLSLSINLCSRQLHQSGLSTYLNDLITQYDFNPHRLELEITEGAIIENLEESIQTLDELKALGVMISMDDFGTGYSSLSYLKQLPVDTLKIDRSFIQEIPEDEDGIAIVSAILSMARALKLEVVAEGVENGEQLEYLKHNNCMIGQGYYFSKPVALPSFWSLLQKETEKSNSVYVFDQ